MTPIRMAFPLMRKSKASSPRCSTSQRATIAPWKPISTRSVVSNGPGRINQAFSVRRSEEHTSVLQSLMRISYAVFCLKKKNDKDCYFTLSVPYIHHHAQHTSQEHLCHIQQEIHKT